MMGNTPILVLREGTSRDKGKGAQGNNIAAAKAIADAVKSTLGPKGMDKMLVDSMGDIVITNDGATILKNIDIEHPAAKMVVEIAKTQDNECGDGTTTAVVVAGELLKRAEALIEQNVHATVISNGFHMASKKANEILTKMGMTVSPTDKKTLGYIATTAMTGKSIGGLDFLSKIAVDAVSLIAEKEGAKYKVDIDNIQVEKKRGGSMMDTKLIKGIILDKERVHPRMPSSVKDAKIALINAALEVKKTEVSADIRITDPTQLQAFLEEEENMLKKMVAYVKKSGANVVFCQKGIDDLAQHFLVKEGIFAVRRAKESDMKKLAKATGAKVVSSLKELSSKDLGKAKLVEERKVADDDMLFVTGCTSPKACSILIRGGTEHILDEAERGLHDALKVVGVAIEDGKAVAGGGAAEMELSLRLTEYASTVGGREQLAIEAFAKAVEVIPRALAENAGLDPIDVLVNLRNAHEAKNNKNHGLDVYSGKVKDMMKEKVVEPLRVKTQVMESATEVATMVLRIDDVIAAKQGQAPPMPPGGGMGGMPPGMGMM